MVGEHVAVVLEVLADLGVIGLEPGLEPRERLVEGQLVRRARVAVRQRDVAGMSGLGAKRNADQPGGQRIKAGGLGVERNRLVPSDAAQPVVQLPWREDGLVGHHRRARCRLGAFACEGAGVTAIRARAAHRNRTPAGQAGCSIAFTGQHRRIGGLGPALKAGERAAHLVAAVDAAQVFHVRCLGGERLHAHRQLDVTADGHQLTPERQKVEVPAQVLADHAANLTCVGNDPVE